MTIIRDGKEYVLTADELEQAYREQKHNYKLADAESQFDDWHCRNFDNEESFAACFGFSGDDVCNVNSKHYLLEKFVERFERNHDCNQAENDIWQEAIRSVLVENAASFWINITYDASYDLWETSNPRRWRKITSLFPAGYSSVEELNATESEYLAKAFERHGIHNGKVAVRTTIKEIKHVGDNRFDTCLNFVKIGWDRYGTMVDGKLVFADVDQD